jgi:predicted metal-dependent hydrolase
MDDSVRVARLRTVLTDAAREFNAGRYFEAHEVLEEALDDVPDRLWELMLGLIQVAVGYHKLSQELWLGGRRMLERGLSKLDPFTDADAGMHLEALRRRVATDIEALRQEAFDAQALKRHPPRMQPAALRSTGR